MNKFLEKVHYNKPKLTSFELSSPFNLLDTKSTDLYLEGIIEGYEHVEF